MQARVTSIQGERVLLRPLRESDLEESLRVWTPELRHMYGGSLTSPERPTLEGRQRWFARLQTGEEGRCFAIEAEDRYIGFAILGRVNEPDRRAGYRIGIENPAYWGRGYGTEVTRLMLSYAFGTLRLHRVNLRVAAYNARAIRCYEKAGFRLEGIERDSFFVDGEWHDDLLMGVLEEEWHRAETAPEAGPRLRTYRTGDYDQVFALWQSVGFSPDRRDSRQALERKLRHDRGPFLVAEADGRVIATALGSWDGRRAWVSRVAVDPAYQGKGLGRRLVIEVEDRLRELGARSAALLVNTEKERTIAFYRRLGYSIEDQVGLMRKMLDPVEER